MARLTTSRAAGAGDDDEPAAAGPVPGEQPPRPVEPASPGQPVPSAGTPDPRAVRVRLAATSQLLDDPVLLVAPPEEPLMTTNPGARPGPLAGAADPDGPGKPAPVLAQRQPLVNGEPVDARLESLGAGRYLLVEADARTHLILEPASDGEGMAIRREVIVDGFRLEVELESERVAALRERASAGRAASAHGGPLEVKAIIPGKVVAISVAAGDAVTAGQQLLVVEAMKMQNELRSPRDGTITRLGVAPGVNIEVGDLLVVID